MTRPDFGKHYTQIDRPGGAPLILSCGYVAPGVTFHDLAMAFEKASKEAEPGDELRDSGAHPRENKHEPR
jgi:hypothetical protein